MKLNHLPKHLRYLNKIERNGAYWQIVCAFVCVCVNLYLILMRYMCAHMHTHLLIFTVWFSVVFITSRSDCL